MNFHVITEKRNRKMLHPRFSQVAQAITIEKADHSLFNHRGKDQLGCFSRSGLLFLLLLTVCLPGMALEPHGVGQCPPWLGGLCPLWAGPCIPFCWATAPPPHFVFPQVLSTQHPCWPWLPRRPTPRPSAVADCRGLVGNKRPG